MLIEYIPYVIFTDKFICVKYHFLPYGHDKLSYIGLLNLLGAKFTCHILNFVSSNFGVGVCIVSEKMLIVFLNMCTPLTDVIVFSRRI